MTRRSLIWNRRRLRLATAEILASGLEAADPFQLIRRNLRIKNAVLEAAGTRHPLGRGRLLVITAGKAASSMAAAAEGVLGRSFDDGLAIDTSSRAPLSRIRLMVAGHPVPDERGLRAAEALERLVSNPTPRDLLLILISGGASALLPAPVAGISLADKAAVTSLLLRSGAVIREMNAVRKHLSRFKGGGLARIAAPARIVCLALSDVVGDDLTTIASGPTVPDPTTYGEAIEILVRHDVWGKTPLSVRQHLESGASSARPETPKPGDALFRRVTTRVIGGNRHSLEAAARTARRLGLRTLVLTSRLEGEAREVARVLTAILRECVETGQPSPPPVCLLAGGETTVTVRGLGRGGRNQELVVASAEPLAAFPSHAVVASMGTDGIDGASMAAGGVVDQETVNRAQALGMAPCRHFLDENDSSSFLAPLGDLIVTGPTGTNVCDLVALLAGDRGRRSPAE
ncbi:MAG: glycerate kinase [Vicinamibacteria bacterium]|nr:glycerate kinase [Vicinamibacteria bacterium]